jgi:hypothetical protein
MELRWSSRDAAMADSRRRSSSGGRLSGWDSFSFEDLPNRKEAVGIEVEEEDRLWVKRFLVGDLEGEDLEGLEGLEGDLRAVE